LVHAVEDLVDGVVLPPRACRLRVPAGGRNAAGGETVTGPRPCDGS
jgi:hypothetical protein